MRDEGPTTYPAAEPSIGPIFWPDLLLPRGMELRTRFLDFLLDDFRHRQPLIWMLSTYSTSRISIGTLVRWHQNDETECHGEVLRFIARDDAAVLFQVKMGGWATGKGWRAPGEGSHLVSFLIAPLAKCTSNFHDAERFAYFTAPTTLVKYTFEIAQRVANANTKDDRLRLPNDPVVTAIHESFLIEPDLVHFSLEREWGSTLTEEDHQKTVKTDVGPAPPDFNPRASQVGPGFTSMFST